MDPKPLDIYCDFCFSLLENDFVWAWPVAAFTIENTVGGAFASSADFDACLICHDLLRANDLIRLCRRVIESYRAAGDQIDLAMQRANYFMQLFEQHRLQGPPQQIKRPS
jgi:hypothetical protein